jgi:hypothetical protein
MPNFFCTTFFKIQIIFKFVKFMVTKKDDSPNYFPPLLFGVGSEIRDGRKSVSEIRDKHPGSATLSYFELQPGAIKS